MKTARVLVVDDSPTIRGIICNVLSKDPQIEVVGTAGDPLEAREAIKALNPDVITLDVEMPKMNGIEFLEKIMRLRPMPVIMVSTLTQSGASISIEALELGAFDCVGKPDFDGIAEKVKAAARARVRPYGGTPVAPSRVPSTYRPSASKVLAIGASTGGVEALLAVLSEFPENCPATVITQHMPPTFTGSFAARLDRVCAPKVMEAVDGAPISAGHVYIAPGGSTHLEVDGGLQPRCRLREGPLVSGHRPSVDVMFRSVCAAYGRRAVGVILTGMGKDGAEGLKELRLAGASTIGQDEATCVVYGMPKAALEAGAVQRQLPLRGIARAALDLCSVEMKGAA
jgi:two-component system, chemotaxis family, protein-glutamate methylesterase/glutaminase